MMESLPDEIRLLVCNMNWTKNTVGMSCDEVWHLTSKTRNFYLKIKRVPNPEPLELESAC